MSYRDDPVRRDSMERFGYKFDHTSTCKSKGCGRTIEWWKTKNGKSVPFDPPQTPSSVMACHWDTCPARKPAADAPADLPYGPQAAVEDFRRKLRAKIVVVIYDETWAADAMPGLAAEDVKQEIITTANALRRAMGGR